MRAQSCLYCGLAVLYRLITSQRNRLYDCGFLRSQRVSLPVISIGNITAGGNGKTPLCIYLASELARRGFRPVVLSRGYGGSLAGPHLVSVDDSPDTVGDEPVLMRRRIGAPVVVSRDRVRGARLIERHDIGDLIVLDDGFQHRRLHRNVDVVAVDISSEAAVKEFSRGSLLPVGRLREDRLAALKRADLIVLVNRGPAEESTDLTELKSLLPKELAVFQSRLKADLPRRITRDCRDMPLQPPAKVAAFCGIAKPDGFFSTLKSLGFDLLAEHVFSDHHRFVSADIESLRKRYPGTALVCTEKDAVKLRSVELASDVYFLSVSSAIIPGEAFIEKILSIITG